MQIAKFTISYDRGLARNEQRDLATSYDTSQTAVAAKGFKTADGKVIRGLGTHYRSETDAQLVQERDKEAKRIYNEIRERFVATAIDGLYVINKRGDAERFVSGLNYRSDIRVYASEYELSAPGELNADEIRAWGEKVRRQLSSISLGRTKEADDDGLRALEYLATCPVLKPETGRRIKELVAGVRDQKLTRVELKRSLETLDVKIEQATLRPRATPKIVSEAA